MRFGLWVSMEGECERGIVVGAEVTRETKADRRAIQKDNGVRRRMVQTLGVCVFRGVELTLYRVNTRVEDRRARIIMGWKD